MDLLDIDKRGAVTFRLECNQFSICHYKINLSFRPGQKKVLLQQKIQMQMTRLDIVLLHFASALMVGK
jgi:hypothetical protein